jgi:hypothetical protein
MYGGERCTGFWLGNLRERDCWGDPSVDGKIILRWIFRKWDVGVWTGLSWLKIGTVVGTFECGNEPLGSIKCGECQPVSFYGRTLLHGVSK